MLIRSFQIKSRKRVVRDAVTTFATPLNFGHVHDVSDANRWAQHSDTHDSVLATFKSRTLFNKQARNPVENCRDFRSY